MADIPSSADRFLLQVHTSLAKSFRQIRLELGRPPPQVSYCRKAASESKKLGGEVLYFIVEHFCKHPPVWIAKIENKELPSNGIIRTKFFYFSALHFNDLSPTILILNIKVRRIANGAILTIIVFCCWNDFESFMQLQLSDFTFFFFRVDIGEIIPPLCITVKPFFYRFWFDTGFSLRVPCDACSK